jgi:peptidoglycan/xylan/chitin deacetylase (PgdA/CDA1 family)
MTYGLAIILGAVAILTAGIWMAYAVRGRSSQVFGPSIWRGDRTKPVIALTFDDGPSEATPELLALLARHQIRATFFMCGKSVDRLPHIARAVAEAGHEIGNHSDSHPRFDFCSSGFIFRELTAAQEKIVKATGVTPRLFRAPYGVRWFGLRAAQQRLNLLGVMWTVIGHDWNWPAPRIAKHITERAAGGGIVCLHDGRVTQIKPDVRPMLDALAIAIPEWQHRGLIFDTVSGMTSLRP